MVECLKCCCGIKDREDLFITEKDSVKKKTYKELLQKGILPEGEAVLLPEPASATTTIVAADKKAPSTPTAMARDAALPVLTSTMTETVTEAPRKTPPTSPPTTVMTTTKVTTATTTATSNSRRRRSTTSSVALVV